MCDLTISTMRLELGNLPLYIEESEQDKGSVTALNSTKWLCDIWGHWVTMS